MVRREPTYAEIPDLRLRLLHDVGSGFSFGAACGCAFHFVRGLRRSPTGGRLAGAARAVRANVPRVAGSFGSFQAVFVALKSAMSVARRKEDRWNSIAAFGATMGIRHMRKGPREAALGAIFSAAFVSLGHGADIMFDRVLMEMQLSLPPPQPEEEDDDDPGLVAPAGHRPTRHGFLGIPRGERIVVEINVA
ncbi:hypothetical protein ACP70R_014362 [Stipagrostis hirtigluma subsp. patula]